MKRFGILTALCLSTMAVLAWFLMSRGEGNAAVTAVESLRADGVSRTEIRLPADFPAKPGGRVRLEAAPGVASLMQVRQEDGADTAVVRAGVVAGAATLVTDEAPGAAAPAAIRVEVTPDWRDENSNGFPDSIELNNPADARAFLDWFRFLAEEQLYRGDEIDPEINDCAALLRYAYREALRRHDGEWAMRVGLEAIRPIPDVRKFNYPYTPLRADLFRLKPGSFQPEDLKSGAFGQFADAETLLLYNSNPIGKDIEQARPGDLLFFRQEAQSMPFHAMLYLGPSMLETGSEGEYVLYHTGPDGSWKGEMRRRTVEELIRHPEPRWHPVNANPAFLGVYRWKLLGAAGGS